MESAEVRDSDSEKAKYTVCSWKVEWQSTVSMIGQTRDKKHSKRERERTTVAWKMCKRLGVVLGFGWDLRCQLIRPKAATKLESKPMNQFP